ncbi:MAG: cyclase family protein [Chloroflexi bacterium]|nr:cyclase family protein [Chloroflexota bacterium]MCY3583461.1 cyclase family protein [Chloroflexota bacterium]MCY3716133.1 cyclase family protein [Chloroflexota bacterium]MDE2650277.1 cyclase family protein [Chloroflexota bacterium]MXV92351.1 cyclase family protein [Chloroflexota bacterium]
MPHAAYGQLPIPRLTPQLLSLVKTGEVYSLGVDFQEGMLTPGAAMKSYSIAPHLRHSDPSSINPAAPAAEVIRMSIHVGTHIDALCHIAEKQDAAGKPDRNGESRLYAAPGKTIPASQSATASGQRHLSIERMPPIVTRGVLLDVAASKGVAMLPPATVISAQDILAAQARQGTEINAGTAVLVRTGGITRLQAGDPAYRDAQTGLDLSAAQCLVEQGMTLVGADNMAVEAMPPHDHSVHRFLLVHSGITHVENLNLDELAAARCYEFLLVIAPLKLTGATGSWVNPLAIS